jgi:nickel transport protein
LKLSSVQTKKTKNVKKILCAAAFLLLSWWAGPVLAHGVGYRQSRVRPVSLEFYYSTGEAMSFREAKVFSPLDEKFPFQSGRTDEEGRLAFTPSVAGQWRVTVLDEEGHMAEARVDVAEGGVGEVAVTAAPPVLELPVRAALGVSLLFNAAALVTLYRRKKAA